MFVPLARLTTRRLSLQAESADATRATDTHGWRTALNLPGLKRAVLTGTGLLRNSAAERRVQALFFAGEATDWQVELPGAGLLQGPFRIAFLVLGGAALEPLSLTLTLESAGALVFTSQTAGGGDD